MSSRRSRGFLIPADSPQVLDDRRGASRDAGLRDRTAFLPLVLKTEGRSAAIRGPCRSGQRRRCADWRRWDRQRRKRLAIDAHESEHRHEWQHSPTPVRTKTRQQDANPASPARIAGLSACWIHQMNYRQFRRVPSRRPPFVKKSDALRRLPASEVSIVTLHDERVWRSSACACSTQPAGR